MGRNRDDDILTPREWQVLGLIREGLSNEQIAAHLGISIDGVKFHVSEILGRLGVHDRLEAARWRPKRGERGRALAPLLLLAAGRRGWLSPVVASCLGVATAAGIGLLIWGLLATRDGEPLVSAVPEATPMATPGSVLVFDVDAGQARRLPVRGGLFFAQWLKEGETYVAYDGEERAWKILDLGGNELRTVAALGPETDPYVTTHLSPSPDWMSILIRGGDDLNFFVYDVATGAMRPFSVAPIINRDPLFSPDGTLVAYVNERVEDASLLVAEADGSNARIIRSVVTSPDRFLAPSHWSPDGRWLFFVLCAMDCRPPDYAYEVIDLEGTVVWRYSPDRLTRVQWAGPDRLFVAQPEVGAEGGGSLEARGWFVSIPDGSTAQAPPVLTGTCCVEISPDGRYAAIRTSVEGALPDGYRGGILPGTARCSVIDLDTSRELVSTLSAPQDVDTAFCSHLDWTADSAMVLVSQGGN